MTASWTPDDGPRAPHRRAPGDHPRVRGAEGRGPHPPPLAGPAPRRPAPAVDGLDPLPAHGRLLDRRVRPRRARGRPASTSGSATRSRTSTVGTVYELPQGQIVVRVQHGPDHPERRQRAGPSRRCGPISFSALLALFFVSLVVGLAGERADAAAHRPDHRRGAQDPGERPHPAHRPRRARRRAQAPGRHLRLHARPRRRRLREPAPVHPRGQPRAAQPAGGDPHQPRGHPLRPRRHRPRTCATPPRSSSAPPSGWPASSTTCSSTPARAPSRWSASRSTSGRLISDAAAEFAAPAEAAGQFVEREAPEGLWVLRRPPGAAPGAGQPAGQRRAHRPVGHRHPGAGRPRGPVGLDGGRGPAARASPPTTTTGCSSASGAATPPRAGPRAAAASGSRSCARSPRPTAAR